MATTFKTFSANDIVTTKTLLHEAIPLTGTIVSGTYSDNNIKNYSHGMFQSVYDYPYLSSSANHIFDISVGYSAKGNTDGAVDSDKVETTTNSLSASGHTQNSKKLNIYNQMAQVLMGYDVSGSVRNFDEDGNLADGGVKLNACVFINFSRLLTKDEIKKGSFSMELDVAAGYTESGQPSSSNRIRIIDDDAQNSYFVNSPAGDYAILYATSSTGASINGETPGTLGKGSRTSTLSGEANRGKVGLLFYQAGIAVVSGSVFDCATSQGATATILVKTSTAADYETSGQTAFTLTSADGTVRTYQFANGSSVANGAVVSGTTIRVRVDGTSDHEDIATNIKNAINASAAHAAKFTIAQSTTTNANDTLTITQATKGAAGNTTIAAITNGNASELTINGGIAETAFSGGGGEQTNAGGGILATAIGTPALTQSSGVPVSFLNMLTGSEISASADAIRHRIYNIEFNNTTELNSTVYFCRVHHNEFNYSTNPTYLGTELSASKIEVKNVASDSPVAYVTGVGLYSTDNELLATAKLSEPLRKDPTNELTLRVRLDY